jgi:hypothetical protein
MTKMHVIGMPWEAVIRASTSTPAAAIGWGSRIGALVVGMEADLALLEVRDCDEFWMEDSQAQMRRCRQRLVAKAVWKAGQRGVITMPEDMPDVRTAATLAQRICLPACLALLLLPDHLERADQPAGPVHCCALLWRAPPIVADRTGTAGVDPAPLLTGARVCRGSPTPKPWRCTVLAGTFWWCETWHLRHLCEPSSRRW